MAIISFCGSDERETGQTLASIAVATMMAIDHNYRILHISTGFRDKTVTRCFWDQNKTESVAQIVGGQATGINNGVEGLIKLLQSNRTSNNIVSDYAKVVFRERLDVLPALATNDINEYNEDIEYYEQIAKLANKDYNMVFIDIDKKMKPDVKKKILEISDIVVLTIKQGADMIEETAKLRSEDEIFSKKNVIIMIGKWDKYSKFNIANVTRELREKRRICAISYNTLFFDASTEGKVADFFLNNRVITDKNDRNFTFMDETKKTCDAITYRIQELRMRL